MHPTASLLSSRREGLVSLLTPSYDVLCMVVQLPLFFSVLSLVVSLD